MSQATRGSRWSPELRRTSAAGGLSDRNASAEPEDRSDERAAASHHLQERLGRSGAPASSDEAAVGARFRSHKLERV
jgi:hypothetical protein